MSESQTTATDLDVAEACDKGAVQPATQELILAELKAIRELLEGKVRPLLVEIAS